MIEDTLAEITTIVSGFMLAVGAILVVTGVNIPLGVGLMAAGAVGLAATVGLNWTAMSSELASTLALITGVVGGFLLALGAIMAFSGANFPLGIALMALGGASLVSAAVINWHNSDRHLTDALTTLTGVLAGASLAVGAMLAFTGYCTDGCWRCHACICRSSELEQYPGRSGFSLVQSRIAGQRSNFGSRRYPRFLRVYAPRYCADGDWCYFSGFRNGSQLEWPER